MPRTDEIILPEQLRKSRALQNWAERAGLDAETADDIWKSATYVIQEMEESGLEPAQCMHVAQIIYMLCHTSCRNERSTAIDFFQHFADHAFDAAEFFAQQCPPAGAPVGDGISTETH